MRLGLVLEVADRAAPLSSLVAQARAAEAAGLELLWCPDDVDAEPALIVAAAMSVHTTGIRLVAEVGAGMHPLAVAESAVVADNCLMAVSCSRLTTVRATRSCWTRACNCSWPDLPHDRSNTVASAGSRLQTFPKTMEPRSRSSSRL